jgi:hypothetical protein
MSGDSARSGFRPSSVSAAAGSIPPEFLEQIKRFIDQLAERDRSHVARVLGRRAEFWFAEGHGITNNHRDYLSALTAVASGTAQASVPL